MSQVMAPRGPYWAPGMNSGVEPWVALAECNTGHLVVPCGRGADQARRVVGRWAALVRAGLPLAGGRRCVGAAVIDPAGAVAHSWGHAPTPGSPRWAPLWRLRDPARCRRCGSTRWAGCWTAPDLDGCSRCLPAIEVADPRTWPSESPKPVAPIIDSMTRQVEDEGNSADDDGTEIDAEMQLRLR